MGLTYSHRARRRLHPWQPKAAGDLVVAATAESANLSVLHYDDDYERIAKVTGQPTEWIAAPGTLDR